MGTISEYGGVLRLLHCEGYDYEKLADEIMEAPLSDLHSQGEWKCSADRMASSCMVKWGLTLSPFLNCYIQI